MLKVNLVLTEYLTGENGCFNSRKRKAAKSIKELLSQIDFSAESVPENNVDMFIRLLTSLKGQPLNEAENELVKEIVS
jgi:hypothetical protein